MRKLSYTVLSNPFSIISATLLSSFINQSYSYQYPLCFTTLAGQDATFTSRAKQLIFEQFLLEALAVIILFLLLIGTAKKFGLNRFSKDLKSYLGYMVIFLPVIGLSFFIFSPVIQSIRYYYHFAPNWHDTVFYSAYLFNTKLYLGYFYQMLAIGYLFLNLNLLIEGVRRVKKTEAADDLLNSSYPDLLFAFDASGKIPLEVDEIVWIDREDRKYYAHRGQFTYQLKENITELEERLDPTQFFRINRSVIINIKNIKSYSYWENEKYVLRLDNNGREIEFIMTRRRVRELEKVLTVKDIQLAG